MNSPFPSVEVSAPARLLTVTHCKVPLRSNKEENPGVVMAAELRQECTLPYRRERAGETLSNHIVLLA
ncbi:hypothetical protein PBY51_004535 [Eleginops maclovinus]|uniref:Uncharacterized protein n=1 Tax=Eleginops maclovinus TaxID=56733 RepID=A0AAN7Y084_ELEMC|nr:hypothetical protein PBY51_004535 [Eleginops maclovinus]